jgi:hypothetical protein
MPKTWFERHLTIMLVMLTVIGVAAAGISLGKYWAEFGTTTSDSPGVWGLFGDYIGGVLGTVFSFLAFVALLMTLRIQSKELALSSTELHNSTNALKDQHIALEKQAFDNRFFNMVTLHHQIVNAIDLRSNGTVTSTGRDSLKVFYERLKPKLKSAARGDHLSYEDGIRDFYEEFFEKHGHELSHYFRNFYRILKFIDESSIPNKTDYTGMLRAQLSNQELALIFYNGFTKHGQKLKPLLEKYAIFENVSPSVLVSVARDLRLYEQSAFGDQIEAFRTYAG